MLLPHWHALFCWCGVAGFTCKIWHARLRAQRRAICLKWENNEAQGVSIKFISCTVPQAVGRWGPPLCTYFHKSDSVMTLPQCKWTVWGAANQGTWLMEAFLGAKKKQKNMRSMRKKSFGPRVEAASNRYTWKIKNPSSVLTFLEAKYLQGGISEGTSSFGRSTERVKGLIGNVPLFSCRNLARAACRPKWCEPRLHHSHREKKKIFQITGCWRGTKKKRHKKKLRCLTLSVFLCAVDQTPSRKADVSNWGIKPRTFLFSDAFNACCFKS